MLRSEPKSMFGSALSSPWFRALLFAAAYFLCAQIGNFLTPPGRTDVIFWLPAGLYVAVLLLNEPRHWGWFIAAALPANLLFDLLKGTSWYLILAFYAANTLQAALGAWLVHTFVAKPTRLRTVKEFFGFLALAGIFATAWGAIVGAGVLHAAGLSEDFLQSAKTWWGSCAMAVLLFSPLVLVWCDQDAHSADLPPAKPIRPRRIVEAICLYGGLTLGTWMIFLMSEGVTTPYKFRTLPFLVWAGLRFGRRGAAAANLIYATLVVYSAGYSQVQPAASFVAAGEVTFTVQTFLVVAALVGLVPAITLTERDATMVKLSESEAHYRNLTEGAFEGVCISDQGRVIDVSNQLLNMIGYSRDEVIGRQMTEFNTPESRAAVAAAVQAEKEATYGVVLQRKDGSTFPCEVRAKMVRLGGRNLRMTALRDITERVKAEEALRSSEARLRAVSDNLPNGLVYQVVREPDGTMRFLHVSAGVERTHGITAEAVLRDPRLLYDQILPEDRERLVAAEERSFATLSVFDEIMRIRRSDGEIRWVRLCSAPRRKPDGHIIWDGIEIDITESKRAEAALRQSEEKFSKAFLSSPSSIVITRQSDGRIMEANDAFCRRYGLTPEQARGQNVYEVGVWRNPQEREALINRLRREGSIRNVEKETILPSGRRSVSLMSLEQITIQGEECLLTVTHDITDLKEAQRALQESEAKFRTLFNTANDAIFLMNREVFLDCNSMTEVMFGCARRDLIGHSPVNFSPPIQADGVASTVRAIEKIEAAFAGIPQFFEWLHIRSDGTTFPAEVSLNRVELGGEQFLQAIVRDITARKQADARLKLLTDRLKLATDAAAIAVWEWNLQTNEVLGNERLFEIYGYPVEPNGRFSYQQWARQVHPDDLPEQESAIQKTIATKGQSVREFRAYRLDGTLRHIHAADITLSDDHGKVTRIVGVNIDITERKNAEEALRENQRMLATLMANLPGLVYRCRNDADWTMEFVSEGSVALTGYRPEDLLYNRVTSFAALIVPEDRLGIAARRPGSAGPPGGDRSRSPDVCLPHRRHLQLRRAGSNPSHPARPGHRGIPDFPGNHDQHRPPRPRHRGEHSTAVESDAVGVDRRGQRRRSGGQALPQSQILWLAWHDGTCGNNRRAD